MLDALSPEVRAMVLELRVRAMCEGRDEAVAQISEVTSKTFSEQDRVALHLLRAELLYLDGRDDDSLEIFKNDIDPLLPSLAERWVIAIGYNRSDVAFGALRPDDFYGVVDHATLAGVDFWGTDDVLRAMRYASEGKHFESLPAFWKELWRTSHDGCWRAYRSASHHMAEECIALGLLSEGAYHATMSLQSGIAERIGDTLLAHGNAETLNHTIDKLLLASNLKRHFLQAGRILSHAVDAIPDARISAIVAWALHFGAKESDTLTERASVEAAWECLRKFAYRFHPEDASSVMKAAISHPAWHMQQQSPRHIVPVRKTMIEAVGRCAPQLDAEQIRMAVEALLPLATDRIHDHDYIDVINVLCNMAHYGGAELTKTIREKLYPTGKRLDSTLLHVAQVLGQELKKVDLLEKDAERIANDVRLVVQRTAPNAVPENIPNYFFITSKQPDQTLVVFCSDFRDLSAILQFRKVIRRETLTAIIKAMLDMLLEPENIMTNKATLASLLGRVADVCTKQDAAKIYSVLAPFAQGKIHEPSCTMNSADAANPLNPFKMSSGKPADLQGQSLITLAQIDRAMAGVFDPELDGLLEESLASQNADVRSCAFVAAREKTNISEACWAMLLLGTRDPDPNASASAFYAIGNKDVGSVKHFPWHALILSAQLAARSAFVLVRREAARAVLQLRRNKLADPATGDRLDELVTQFVNDRCFSVRNAALENKEAEDFG